MKACPDCAESIQDAARKCRYCGYRFDVPADLSGEQEPAAEPEPPAAASSRSPTPAPAAARAVPGWPFLIVALGGLLIGIGGLVTGLAPFVDHRQLFMVYGSFGLPAGGLLLAVGWGILMARGAAHLGAVLGSLAVPAAFLTAAMVLGNSAAEVPYRGMILLIGLLACACGHLGTLEALLFNATRVAVQIAMIGLFAQVFASTKSIELPQWLDITFGVLGIGGMLLFGFALAVAAFHRAGERS